MDFSENAKLLTYDMEKRGSESLYAFLYRCIKSDIECGAIAPDERLPSKRALAQHLGVSVITVQGAYAQLLAEGYLYARERRGYYASELPGQRGGALAAPHPVSAHTVLREQAARRAVEEGEPGKDAPAAEFDLSDGRLGDAANEAALWGRALRGALNEEPAAELFGDLPAAGHARLQRAIAGHLRSFRGMDVDPSCILVGAGAQLFYALIAQMLGSGTCMAVEDPGFSRIERAYSAAGLTVRPTALDLQGIRTDELIANNAHAVHVMPSHQFPTGIVTSASRRYELLGWAAEEQGRYIVEDDYDCEFRLAGRPVPALASVDAYGRVLYLNTFSKSLSSALRMAYLVLPPELAQRFESEFGFYACTVSALDQITLARLIEAGDYERHINRVRTRHRLVRDALVEPLHELELAERIRIHGLDAGLHFVLEVMASGEDAVLRAARAHGVRLAPLSRYCMGHAAGELENARFVVQYGSLTAERAQLAGEQLAAALRALESIK